MIYKGRSDKRDLASGFLLIGLKRSGDVATGGVAEGGRGGAKGWRLFFRGSSPEARRVSSAMILALLRRFRGKFTTRIRAGSNWDRNVRGEEGGGGCA